MGEICDFRDAPKKITLAISLVTLALKASWEDLDMFSNVPVNICWNSLSDSMSFSSLFSHHGIMPGIPQAGPDSWKKSLCSSSAVIRCIRQLIVYDEYIKKCL